jgi:hypothetical protein
MAPIGTHIRIFGNAGLVIGDGDHRDIVFGDERQDGFELLLFAGYRVDERAALHDLKSCLERRGDGGVDADRRVSQALDDLKRLAQQWRLRLIRVDGGDTGIDVKNMRAGLNLGQGVLDHAIEIAGLHLGCELLAAGGIDALADDGEGAVEADDVLAGRGSNESVRHVCPFPQQR